MSLAAELASRMAGELLPGYQIELPCRRKDGETIWVRLATSAVRDPDGGLLYGLYTLEDITDAKETADARAAQHALVAVVSHDLQNPLSAIGGLARHLADAGEGAVTTEQRDLLRRVEETAERMRTMVVSFLDITRLHRGQIQPQCRPAEIVPLVWKLLEGLDLGGHSVAVEGEPVVVAVDAGLVERIVANLVVNAVRHTEPGSPIRVRVEAARRDARAGVLLTVDDTGPGVPEKARAAMLQPGPVPAGGDTGWGLWVAGRFTELHGGRAWVEDRPGGGASLRVFLPENGTAAGQHAEKRKV